MQVDSVFDLKDIKDFGRGNALQALNFVIKQYGCEIEADNFVIHLKAQIGADHGLQYRFKKNIISDSFEDNVRTLVTRMYSQMKDGLTFINLPASNLTTAEYDLLNAVPGAIVGGLIKVNYLISSYASTWTNITNTYYDGELIDQNIEDQLELLEATRKALLEQEVPAIDVSINAADLFKIDSSEIKPNLGDTVYLIDPDMELNNITARVVEITEYPYEKDKHTQVTLANYLLRDYGDIIADLDRSKRIVDDLMSGGRVRANIFEAFARQAVIDINNSKTQVRYDTRGIVLQDTLNALNQVVMSANGIYLTTNGGTSSVAAITAAGVIAERIIGVIGSFVQISANSIVTGSLQGINIAIGSGKNIFKADTNGIYLGNAVFGSAPFRSDMAGNVIANSITLTGTVNNSAINSSTITGGTLQTSVSGRRVVITGNTEVFYDGTGTKRISVNDAGISSESSVAFFHNDGLTLSAYMYQTGSEFIINGGNDSIGLFNIVKIKDGFGSLMDGNAGASLQFQLAGKSAIGHTHPQSDIIGLITALSNKTAAGSTTSSFTIGDHNHGFAHGLVFKDTSGIDHTWNASGGFTHSHTTS